MKQFALHPRRTEFLVTYRIGQRDGQFGRRHFVLVDLKAIVHQVVSEAVRRGIGNQLVRVGLQEAGNDACASHRGDAAGSH